MHSRDPLGPRGVAGGLALVAIVLLALHAVKAYGQEPDPEVLMCKRLAEFVRNAADVRDTGADLRKHLDVLRRRLAQASPPLVQALEREIRRVYKLRLPRDEAEQDAYMRCMAGEVFGERI